MTKFKEAELESESESELKSDVELELKSDTEYCNFVLNHRWLFTDFKQVINLVVNLLALNKSKT